VPAALQKLIGLEKRKERGKGGDRSSGHKRWKPARPVASEKRIVNGFREKKKKKKRICRARMSEQVWMRGAREPARGAAAPQKEGSSCFDDYQKKEVKKREGKRGKKLPR